MSQKQTIYVEPASHNNSRTEFNIPNYQGRNYRLVGMGLTNYVPSGGPAPHDESGKRRKQKVIIKCE